MQCIKRSYYQFKRQQILQKAKKGYFKEKAAEYYLKNKEVKKKMSKNWYKNLFTEENKIKKYQRERYQLLIQCKNKARSY